VRNKTIFGIIAAIFTVASLTQAKVTVDILDPAEGKYLVTYEVSLPDANSIFPSNGSPSKDQPLEVRSLIRKDSGVPVEYEILQFKDRSNKPVEGRYTIQSKHAKPKKTWSTFEYQLVLCNKSDCYIDSEGRLILLYETAQDATFVVPEGRTMLSANYPVVVIEQDGKTLLQQDQPKENKNALMRKFVFSAKPSPLKWWQSRTIRLY
jgi:hypothetical protein